jgi:two-component system sensor histidine kinase KdpD
MSAEEAQRASPDALLALAQKEGRGRLQIFLGAAPGVGKTYAMLTAAKAEQATNRDVVIGLVETHGRYETEALLGNFEIIPRKPILYRNQILKEFDLDAALARRPGLLLVDEYAHTNVPGSRHPKRWQDVSELLAAGIDVWTTLNIQHLESLNDVIQKITRVRVRETVPDRVFDEADGIILVDFPPDELLKRLAEGKVYVQDTAARAVESFFRPQNLTALRELALRRAAERVDADLLECMQAQAIEGPWAAGERILACVGPDPHAGQIVRTAKRLADLMDAPWLAVTVERPAGRYDETARRRIDDTLKLAETLGAETKMLVGGDIAGELLRFARFENVTQLVVGQSRAGFLAELFRRSLPHELVRRAEGLAIHLVTASDQPVERPGRRWFALPRHLTVLPFVWSTLAVVAAVLTGRLMTALTPFPNVSMIFLIAVLFPAVLFGVWPAIYASILSFLAYNFFFIAPVLTFTVAQPHELFALIVFLVVAVITSALGGRVREQARIAADRTRASRRLYEFTRKLSALADVDSLCEGIAGEVNASLARPTVVLMGDDGDIALRAAWPPEDALDAASMSAARWAFTHDEAAGANTGTLPRNRVGVIGVVWADNGSGLDPEARALLETLADQSAVALERALLARDIIAAKTAAETERIRNTLLASISHDFRTPLASILGSATTLIDYGDQLDSATHASMLGAIKQETEGLDDMVRNLLAIIRIDAGALELRWDWVDLREIVERVVHAARRRGMMQTLVIDMPNEIPLIRGDATLIEQIISNVIRNAAVHTSAGTRVTIDTVIAPDRLDLRVTDDGPGIGADVLPHVFEKFVRARSRSDAAGGDGGEGTGLGLAIARGIMEAHHGSIAAVSPVDGRHGARIVIMFPRTETQQ